MLAVEGDAASPLLLLHSGSQLQAHSSPSPSVIQSIFTPKHIDGCVRLVDALTPTLLMSEVREAEAVACSGVSLREGGADRRCRRHKVEEILHTIPRDAASNCAHCCHSSGHSPAGHHPPSPLRRTSLLQALEVRVLSGLVVLITTTHPLLLSINVDSPTSCYGS